MICVSVFYPDGPGKKFDHDYYAKTHMPMAMDLCKSHGMIRYEIDTGLAGGAPGSAAPFAAVGRLYFNTLEEFQSAIAQHGPALIGDVPNYTNIELQIQVSQMSASQ